MKPGVRIWLALIRKARRKAIAADLVQRRRGACQRCCATARAMGLVRAQWVAAGIDKGE